MDPKNNSEYCSELLGSVSKSFDYLFNEYEFAVIHQAQAKLGEYCLLILGSPFFRIQFFQERASMSIYFGDQDAPLDWYYSFSHRGLWFPYAIVLSYFQSTDLLFGSELRFRARRLWSMSVDEQLDLYANETKPLMPEIQNSFQGKSKKFSVAGLVEYEETLINRYKDNDSQKNRE